MNDRMTKARVTTPACPLCGQTSVMYVDKERLALWRNGMVAQRAFPDLAADERELLMTGTHADCWDDLTGFSDE